MRVSFCVLFFISFSSIHAQVPLYEYRELKKSLTVPENINRERSIVIVHVPDHTDDIRMVGDWKVLASEAHKAFTTMGIDPILYLNHYDLIASKKSREIYAELFSKRQARNLIFLTQRSQEITLMIVPFSGDSDLIGNNSNAFYLSDSEMYSLMLRTGKEIRRADHEIYNFLVPEKPDFLAGISIIEKSQLKNYPGILRRSTLAVERFSIMSPPKDAGKELLAKFDAFNKKISEMNNELEILIKQYPYDYVIIDPMSDEALLRNKHQFVLRSVSGPSQTLRQMLDYNVDATETAFVSIIPVLPDQTRVKPIPRNALVHKFYIKQNISKNVHIGEWDADETWQEALKNMIGNLILEHESKR